MRVPLTLSIAGHTIVLAWLILLAAENPSTVGAAGKERHRSRSRPVSLRSADRPRPRSGEPTARSIPPLRSCRRRRLQSPSLRSRQSSRPPRQRRKFRSSRWFKPSRRRHQRSPKASWRHCRRAIPSLSSRRNRSCADRRRAQLSLSRRPCRGKSPRSTKLRCAAFHSISLTSRASTPWPRNVPESDLLIHNAGAVPRGNMAESDDARWRAGGI